MTEKIFTARKDEMSYVGPFTEDERLLLNQKYIRSNGQVMQFKDMGDRHLINAYKKRKREYNANLGNLTSEQAAQFQIELNLLKDVISIRRIENVIA